MRLLLWCSLVPRPSYCPAIKNWMVRRPGNKASYSVARPKEKEDSLLALKIDNFIQEP